MNRLATRGDHKWFMDKDHLSLDMRGSYLSVARVNGSSIPYSVAISSLTSTRGTGSGEHRTSSCTLYDHALWASYTSFHDVELEKEEHLTSAGTWLAREDRQRPL